MLRSATIELDEDKASSEFSEEDEIADFKKSLRTYGTADIAASKIRDPESDDSDEDWIGEAAVDICQKMDLRKVRAMENLGRNYLCVKYLGLRNYIYIYIYSFYIMLSFC